jgi:predicted RNase H-like nuclease
MGYVLGIDAAWTVTNPSGVALLACDSSPPRLIRASPSYEDFVLGTGPATWCAEHDFRASLQDVLDTAATLGAASLNVIAVDMPVARQTVRGRRVCDQLISRSFGGRGCATHTPTKLRPGKVSEQFLEEANRAGFALVTTSQQRPRRALLEVYPHVAVLELCGADYRVPYKLSRRRRYWSKAAPREQLVRIRSEWDKILRCLSQRIAFDFDIDCTDRPMQFWKAWEDVIDAVVCSYVGLRWLSGQAQPYGDDLAAIWVPEKVDVVHGTPLA